MTATTGRFVVRHEAEPLPPAPPSRTRLSSLHPIYLTPALAACLAAVFPPANLDLASAYFPLAAAFIVFCLPTSVGILRSLVGLSRGQSSQQDFESFGCAAAVEILPLGVQISKSAGTKLIGTPKFIPREDVLDVVVSEVVNATSVESKVIFRIRARAPLNEEISYRRAADDKNITKCMKDGRVELVDAFPGMRLTYVQCIEVWEGIMASLDKL